MRARNTLLLLASSTLAVFSQAQQTALPSLQEVLASKQDLWGLAAMRQPNGPSYEFFENLLPPLRYVNAAFRYYPIVLSAPGAGVKARLTSNGSGLNARATLKTWKEVGVPVTFGVGDHCAPFGSDLKRLIGPRFELGYLPLVSLTYEHSGAVYEEESFAAVSEPLAAHGIVFIRFGLSQGKAGKVFAFFDSSEKLLGGDGVLSRTNGDGLAWFDARWKWDPAQRRLAAALKRGQEAVLVVATKPAVEANGASAGSVVQPAQWQLASRYDEHRKEAMRFWQALVSRAAQIEVPEPLVNMAWRALLVNNFSLVLSNRPLYSAGNQYDRLYEAECGDTARGFLLWGYTDETARMMSVLLDFERDALKYHNAGFKFQNLAHYYWLTRDKVFVQSVRAKCEDEAQLILQAREKESGLLPREQYCGDIFTPVYSLHANAACWRALRDYAAVLADMGDTADAERLGKVTVEYRQTILAAAEKSERRDVQPPFIPLALFGEEKPYETLTSSMLGSYWDLMAPYMLGSGVFGHGSECEQAFLDYLHEHGGVCMGMIRFDQHSGLFANEDAVDDLYSLRYAVKLLQLDEVDRALVSFYGKLAQGLTRDTFVGAEGTGLRPLDEFGRPMYLPPNSTAQAYFLWLLRYLLVQDWDMDDDGKPETLRLCFATPKRWLEDGKTMRVQGAPTAFGPVSFTLESKLSRGEVVAHLELPTRNPAKATFLRVRVPDGWRVVSAKAGGRLFSVDERGTADVSSIAGRMTIRFQVERSPGASAPGER